MEFKNRLKELRLSRELTQDALAEAIGVTPVAIRNWEKGQRDPAKKYIIELSKVLGVSTDTLLGIESRNNEDPFSLSNSEIRLISSYRALDAYGKKAVEVICKIERERVNSSTFSQKTIEFNTSKRERYIPRYSTPSAAGINVPLDGNDFEMMLVDAAVPFDADYAVNIQGNSMHPYINDGDMVYVKKTEDLSVGDVGIFCVDGAMYCKQFYKDKNESLVLVSANPDLRHTNIIISPDSGHSVQVCGKVLLEQRTSLPDYIFED